MRRLSLVACDVAGNRCAAIEAGTIEDGTNISNALGVHLLAARPDMDPDPGEAYEREMIMRLAIGIRTFVVETASEHAPAF